MIWAFNALFAQPAGRGNTPPTAPAPGTDADGNFNLILIIAVGVAALVFLIVLFVFFSFVRLCRLIATDLLRMAVESAIDSLA